MDMALQPSTAQRRAIKERADSFEVRIGAIASIVAGRFSRGSIALQTKRALSETRLNEERDALAKRKS
jgi:hypothetical protein